MEELQTIIDELDDLVTSIHITSDVVGILAENFENMHADDREIRRSYHSMWVLHPALSDRFEIEANLAESIYDKLSNLRQLLAEKAAL